MSEKINELKASILSKIKDMAIEGNGSFERVSLVINYIVSLTDEKTAIMVLSRIDKAISGMNDFVLWNTAAVDNLKGFNPDNHLRFDELFDDFNVIKIHFSKHAVPVSDKNNTFFKFQFEFTRSTASVILQTLPSLDKDEEYFQIGL